MDHPSTRPRPGRRRRRRLRLTYLELYAGIGGWRMALEQAVVALTATRQTRNPTSSNTTTTTTTTTTTSRATPQPDTIVETHCVGALDHSDLCVHVYRHNFGNDDDDDDNVIEEVEIEKDQEENHGNNNDDDTTNKNNIDNDNNDGNPATNNPNNEDAKTRAGETKKQKTMKKKKKKNKKIKLGRKPFNIESLTVDQIVTDLQSPAIWFLSPPCQPHTRQHDQQEYEWNDPRSNSLAHLGTLLQQLPDSSLPYMIALENVVQFETSKSCQHWLSTLQSRDYQWAEFHLTPTQVGLPNDRPRYFCLAVRVIPLAGVLPQQTSMLHKYFSSSSSSSSSASDDSARTSNQENNAAFSSSPELPHSSSTILHNNVPEVGIEPEDTAPVPPPIQEFLDDYDDPPSSSSSSLSSSLLSTPMFSSTFSSSSSSSSSSLLRVPAKVLERTAAWCFDIVTPQSTRSSCFTSSYGRFVRGTGSVLLVPSSTTTTKNNNNNSAAAIETISKKKKKKTMTTLLPLHHENTKNTTIITKNLHHHIETTELLGMDDDPAPSQGRRTLDVPPILFGLVNPKERTFDDNAWLSQLDLSQQELRYFSGTELARLFGFPVLNMKNDKGKNNNHQNQNQGGSSSTKTLKIATTRTAFTFPSDCTIKQQWKLLGNSINVRLASRLIQLGLLASGLVNFLEEDEDGKERIHAADDDAQNNNDNDDDDAQNNNNDKNNTG